MDDFELSAGKALDSIRQAIDTSGLECDVEQKGDGVLDIVLSDDSHIIVNRHAAAKEIWVAAKSGGYHFSFDGRNWIDSRHGEELFASLSRHLSEQGGEQVVLRSHRD